MNNHRLARKVWQIILWANWAIIFFFWFRGSGSLLSQGLASILIASGRLAGLTAAYMVLQQFFFMGRMPWLERVFGLDKLSRMHHDNGKRGLFFLLLHPILLLVGYSLVGNVGLWAQLKSFMFQYEHVLWATLGLDLFIIVAGTSIFLSVRKRFRYEMWYFVHLLAYLAVFASFWHQTAVGTDILVSRVFYGYWVGLYTVVFTSHLIFRFARPVYNYLRHGFRISRVERETHNTVSVYIKGKDLAEFPIHAGQFMILRFLTDRLWWQAHPFSLSMMPDGNELRVTIKSVGDFTSQIPAIPVGTGVMIDGPYGVFTELFSVSPKVLFIAGGIGITPIRSLMEAMARHKKDVALLYANRTEKDIVFRKELDTIASEHGGVVTHVISHDPAYQGEKGYLDKEKISRLVPDLSSREVYLCGPVAMMKIVRTMLADLGVAPRMIHYEEFSL